MKVLMFGWEFPPFNKGGLGTACHGLTKSLSEQGVDVTFVVPRIPGNARGKFVNLISADDISQMRIKHIDSPLTAYMTQEEYYQEILRHSRSPTKQISLYGKNLFAEVERYAQQAKLIATSEEHDVIHAHDWMTYQAGLAAREVSGKPLVVHIHATELDRTGGNGVHQHVYDIERRGMHEADRVLAVSQFTKNKVIEHYGVPAEKIEVVHNAVEFTHNYFAHEEIPFKEEKVVLFLGRITLQKGPDYFIQAAKRVLEVDANVTFVMAGSGDMQPMLIEKAANLGIADKFLFTGFLRGRDVDKAYKMADVYVMPSVSEPFGITPLEALRNDVPVIISNQSGVSEVLQNCLKVDFWDVDALADKIVSVLHHQELHRCLQQEGNREVHQFSWDHPARKCVNAYETVISKLKVKV